MTAILQVEREKNTSDSPSAASSGDEETPKFRHLATSHCS